MFESTSQSLLHSDLMLLEIPYLSLKSRIRFGLHEQCLPNSQFRSPAIFDCSPNPPFPLLCFDDFCYCQNDSWCLNRLPVLDVQGYRHLRDMFSCSFVLPHPLLVDRQQHTHNLIEHCGHESTMTDVWVSIQTIAELQKCAYFANRRMEVRVRARIH